MADGNIRILNSVECGGEIFSLRSPDTSWKTSPCHAITVTSNGKRISISSLTDQTWPDQGSVINSLYVCCRYTEDGGDVCVGLMDGSIKVVPILLATPSPHLSKPPLYPSS